MEELKILECNNLTKSYHKKPVVNHLSFHVNRGEIFAFIGKNGAGKTTAVKMILGLVPMDSGEVKFAENIRVGYSPETPYFLPFLTGYEALDYYGGLQKIPRPERRREIVKLLDTVGLENSRTKIRNYSKGMLQRLALAQSLLGSPDLLILDEPTAGLDAPGRVEIMGLMETLKKSGRTIMINSHILNDLERICDRGIIIKNGARAGTWNKTDLGTKTLEEVFLDLVGGTTK